MMDVLSGLFLFIGVSVANGQLQLAPVFTTTGMPCAFPFLYLSRTYYECTSIDTNDGFLWCGTTHNYDTDRRWGYCAVIETYSGKPCFTPTWKFLGNTFTGCTNSFIGIPWCGTQAVVPQHFDVGSWGFCKVATAAPTPAPAPIPATCDVQTTGGTAVESTQCAFPFTFKEVTYKSCTGLESRGAWCSITSNYQGGWGYCVYKQAVIGASNGQNCVFPFIYRGTMYNYCVTLFNNFVPWCATTANFDSDGQWGNCALPTCDAVVP